MAKYILKNRKNGPLSLNCVPSIHLRMWEEVEINEEQRNHPDVIWAINNGKAKVMKMEEPIAFVKKDTPFINRIFNARKDIIEDVDNNEGVPMPERARDDEGKFVADDPETDDINEAWKDGVEPIKKKSKKKSKKNVDKSDDNS